MDGGEQSQERLTDRHTDKAMTPERKTHFAYPASLEAAFRLGLRGAAGRSERDGERMNGVTWRV